MEAQEARIRPYRDDDLDALYRICLQTADTGKDATSLYRDPMLPGHVYAAPYGLFEPSLAFVAEDAAGVGGYVLGAADSQAFANRLESDWWPALRERYSAPGAEVPRQRWTPDQRVASAIHHPRRIPGDLAERYPSHLHIDLLPRLQGRGYGRRMMNVLLGALRDQDSQGVHLAVSRDNQRAVAFYRRLGFTALPATGLGSVFGMVLRRGRSPAKGGMP